MKKVFLITVALLFAAGAWAQTLTPTDITPIYRRSFTARYELTGVEPVREAALSPDKKLVAFVRAGDLFVRDTATGHETRITTDGERNKIINGATDWVYEEEYGFTRAWEFSPDSRRIAYLRFDESRVREFSMMRYDENLYPEPYTFKYPKAGEENSVVTLHVYDIKTGRTRQINTDAEFDNNNICRQSDADVALTAGFEGSAAGIPLSRQIYIPRIGWTPGGDLFFYRVNRLQNRFEVVLGNGKVIYDETSSRYVERPDERTVTFLQDGDRFTVKNETRTGWWQSYLYSIEHGFLHAMPSEDGPREGDIYRFLENPPADGREFFSFTNDAGIELYGWMLKPAGFDPAKKYPVFMTQYSGPGSVSVFVERLGSGDRAIYDPLLQADYIVVCVDPRGTGGRGEEFKKCTYGQLGKFETEDQITAARHLGSLPYVDPARIGIYGWSYGGFIALNSILKGAEVFSLAVAVAPVTSWRFYDTIYTEIYNGLPQDNPGGYDDNSPVNYAHLLQGRLLLVHGTGDDNVHVQNSFEMAKALVKSGKEFDMMIYPDDNHSMRPSGSRHVRQKIVDYILEHL